MIPRRKPPPGSESLEAPPPRLLSPSTIHHPPSARTVRQVLVIGYGNELRGDDSLGPRVAEAVAAWRLPGVRALACHQLTPELADPISRARIVLFVDAAADPKIRRLTTRSLRPAVSNDFAPHRSAPPALLALAKALFGRSPRAWLLTLPASDFAFGETLSPVAQRSLRNALTAVRRRLITL